MKHKLPILCENRFFSALGLFFAGLVFLSVILAFFGLFYAPAIILYITIGIFILARLFFKNNLFSKIDRSSRAVFLMSLGFILLFSAFTVPTVFSGRDQGSYSEAAIRLSQNHKLEFSTPASGEFFKIYGPGKALDFPGFNYTKEGRLITQFPVGYISWLATFYSLFGLSGLTIANAVSFFVFLLSFYLLARTYLSKIPLIASYLLLVTSFIFSWFFKFTLSENLALALVWFGILQLVMFLKNKDKLYLTAAILSFGALIFVRIEAWAFLFMIAVVLAVKYGKNFRKIFNRLQIYLISLTALLFLVSLKINNAFYISFAKGFLKSVENPIKSNSDPISSLIYLWKVLNLFSLLPFIILAIVGLVYFLKKKQYDVLIPFFIVVPTFIYLIHPGISDDYPWMLRRFLFSVAPVCILYCVIFLDHFFKNKHFLYALFFLLLISNVAVSFFYLPVSENKNLLEQVQKMSASFKNQDLVLVDQKATGDGFSMLTGPLSSLYGKQAVYFINPPDLDKIDQKKFSRIYFIVPDDSLNFYEKSGLMERLSPVKDYVINSNRLNLPESGKIELPMEQKMAVRGKIYTLK